MASVSKMTVRVTNTKTASTVRIATSGQYLGLAVNDVDADLTGEPIYTNAASKAFWQAVLSTVTAYVNSLP